VLYAGRVRLWHLALVLLIGLLAVAVAVGTTPAGEVWAQRLLVSAESLVNQAQGLFP
jgi:hypothetical protein